MRSISKFFKDESGASAAEYALIIGIVTVGIVIAVGTLATNISAAITTAAGDI